LIAFQSSENTALINSFTIQSSKKETLEKDNRTTILISQETDNTELMKSETSILPPTGQVVPQGGKTVEGSGAVAPREMKEKDIKEKENFSNLV
jgi:hypothetical protein